MATPAIVNETQLHIWGCRGGRNTWHSRIGNATSCYSLAVGADLFVFDAGRGLGALAAALAGDERLRAIERLHVLVTHAHLDHWEGLKDAEWMWRRDNGLELTVLGPQEALDTIAAGHAPPAFVPLEVLALGTLRRLSFVALAAGASVALPGATLETVALHHYSGLEPNRRYLDTLGYRLAVTDGPTVAYLSDHEPTAATRALEDAVVATAQLVIVDANHSDVAQHTFGHGFDRVRGRAGAAPSADARARRPSRSAAVGSAHRRRVRASRRRLRQRRHRRRGRRRGVAAVARPLRSPLSGGARGAQERPASSLERSGVAGSSCCATKRSTSGGTAVKRSVHAAPPATTLA